MRIRRSGPYQAGNRSTGEDRDVAFICRGGGDHVWAMRRVAESARGSMRYGGVLVTLRSARRRAWSSRRQGALSW